MAAIWNSDGLVLNWQITNLHGDIVADINGNSVLRYGRGALY